MTDGTLEPAPFRVPSWILWLTWIYVALFGLSVVFQIASLVIGQSLWTVLFGIDVPAVDHVTVWWVLLQLPYVVFAIGCVGVLLKDRDFAWVAVFTAWVVAVLQSVQAVLQLAHLRISVPIGAFLFVAYAIGVKRVLRPPHRGRSVTDRGTI
jgi:hypothetical protein